MAGFVLAMLMCCCPQGGKAQTTEVFGLKQGVNVGDWLSQKANISFKESDVQMLSNLKYDHIRIPVDESILFNADGSKNAESFTKLHTAVEWARKYNLKVIVDLHILNDNTSSGSMTILKTASQANGNRTAAAVFRSKLLAIQMLRASTKARRCSTLRKPSPATGKVQSAGK